VAHLAERGFQTFLPLIPRLQQWKDRQKLVEFPLFPSYVFARFTLLDVHTILRLPGVSTIVRLGGQPAAIPEREIENVRRFATVVAELGLEPEPVPYLGEGDRVRVAAGPLRGVEGVVVERRGRHRVLVGLRVIGRGLEVDIDRRYLKLLGSGPPRDRLAATL